jgi:hypothetical protein
MLIFSDVLLFLLLSLLLSCFIRRLFQLPKVPTAKTRRSPGHVRRPTGPTPFRPLLRSLPRVLKTPSSPSHPPPSSHVSIFIVSLPTWPSILFRFLVSLSLSLAASAFSLLSFSLNLAFFLRSFGRSLFRIPYSYPSIPLPSLLIKPPTPVHQPARCITFFGSLSLSSTNRVWRKEGEHKGAGWVGHSIATVRLS